MGRRLGLYKAASRDFLDFLHGRYRGEVRVRPQDAAKLKRLKSGPSLYLTAHFHHWEWMGSWLTRQGIPLKSGARPMAHPPSQALLVRLRRRLGMEVVFQDMPRAALRHLRAGGCFAFLWDQRVAASDFSAPLFGHSVLMDPLPFFLVKHEPVPVYLGVLLPDGCLRILTLADPGRARLPYRSLARRYHRVLECMVRAYPSHWYGLLHRRFQGIAGPDSLVHVSRETCSRSGTVVSRETISGLIPSASHIQP